MSCADEAGIGRSGGGAPAFTADEASIGALSARANALDENAIFECAAVVRMALNMSILFCDRFVTVPPAAIDLAFPEGFDGVGWGSELGGSSMVLRLLLEKSSTDESTIGQTNPVRGVKSGR
jgi:hypothetical protein